MCINSPNPWEGKSLVKGKTDLGLRVGVFLKCCTWSYESVSLLVTTRLGTLFNTFEKGSPMIVALFFLQIHGMRIRVRDPAQPVQIAITI